MQSRSLYEYDARSGGSAQEPFDFSRELELEAHSRHALRQSVEILSYKGITGEAQLLELLKVNAQLPRPVTLEEVSIIADSPSMEAMHAMEPEAYLQVMQTLREMESALTEGRPGTPQAEEAPPEGTQHTQHAVDQAIAARDVKALYANLLALVELRARSSAGYAVKKGEIKEAFGKAINLNDLERAVTEEQRRQERAQREDEQDIADIARDWAYMNREYWAYDMRNKVWRWYNGAYWEELDPKSPLLDNEAVDALHEAGRKVNSLGCIETFLRCAADARATIFAEEQPGKINFQSATLDVETLTLHPHSREDYLTYCLPYDYAPGPHPQTDAMLETIIPDPYGRIAYMAHLGLALLRDTKLHNAVILLGTTRSGKTTLLAQGNGVCGSPMPYDFVDHHVFSRELEGKRTRYKWNSRRLTCVDEMPVEALKDEELFKQMSAHSGVGMRGMYKDDKEDDNRWRPKLLMAANDRPSWRDIVGAVRERCIFIDCPNYRAPGERDVNLLEKVRPELGAFAASCIFLAKAVLQRGYYPLSNTMKHLVDEIDKEGSYLKSFLAECCVIEPDSGDRITTDALWQAYRSYCTDNGVRDTYQLTKERFSRQLVAMRLGIRRERFFSDEGKLARGLVNIRLRMEQDPWLSEEEELRRFHFDEPLLDGMLTVVDGKMTVQPHRVIAVEPPVAPEQQGPLTPMTLLEEKVSPTIPPLVKHTDEADEGRSPEREEQNSPDVSYVSPVRSEPLVEPAQPRDTSYKDVVMPVAEVSSQHHCEVRGCEQLAEPINQEDVERYGAYCRRHEDRLDMMVFGEMLPEPYPRLPLSPCSSVMAGVSHWRMFATYETSPIGRVLDVINVRLQVPPETGLADRTDRMA